MHAVLSRYLDIYRMLFRRRALLARFGVVMCVVVMGFSALCTYAIGWTAPAMPFAPQPWINYFLGLWFSVLLAVRWHRLVLLDERQAALLDIWPGRREFWFLARFFLVGLATGIFFYLIISILLLAMTLAMNNAFILGPLTMTGGTPYSIPAPITAAIQSAAFSFGLAGFGLILPAAALERPLTMRQSWRATADHGLWFFALILLVDLPFIVVESVLFWIDVPEIVSLPLYMAVWWVTIAATATALSFNYVAVIGRPDEAAPPPVQPLV